MQSRRKKEKLFNVGQLWSYTKYFIEDEGKENEHLLFSELPTFIH